MNETTESLFPVRQRRNWIRLRTMILLRWVSIFGQLTAILVGQYVYHLDLQLGLCYFAVGISVIGNLIAMYIFPENKRLSEGENLGMVIFDLLQLGFLLYLSGGLHNPFSLLLLGPVTISANILTTRSAIIAGTAAIALVTYLSQFHLTLRAESGMILRMPPVLIFGNWIAIIIAIVFFGTYLRRLSSEMHAMADALLATQMALSREQKLTDLGGVVAAAAHELGTPLATIKLTSSELMSELSEQDDLYEDAALIREQADRCRDILRDMGRAGKDDLHLHQAPLMTVISEAAEPHIHRGKTVYFSPDTQQHPSQPLILRKPEIIHGIRNLVQNAVDFAQENVWVECFWDDTSIRIRILDDGKGFPPHLLGRIGDPFVGNRKPKTNRPERPGYEGMGLGLFIAKTLLERVGAEVSFTNGRANNAKNKASKHTGAIINVKWPRDKIDAKRGENTISYGKNQNISY